ncbi:MAG TPA: hypothetical protein PLU22_27715, partial [Polyangiaceae bacterium]|nr:hypothetical protein [Polyangiaceae bacterium]
MRELAVRAGAAHGRLRAGPAARKQAASFDPLEAAQWSAVSTLLARMSDEPEAIRALATRFFDAIQNGDAAAIEAIYDPAVEIWH